MARVDQLNAELQAKKNQIAAKQALIDRNKYLLANNWVTSVRAAASAEIPVIEAQMKTLNQELADIQNKVYEETGQYDKLVKGDERDAYMALNALFKNYGLESLAGKIYDFVKNGYSADTISIMLQDTAEYKQRFAANELRKKAGLSVLNPEQYLATERSYRQIMSQAGLPVGFYDSQEDFTNFLAGDVSPTELQSRVDLASQASTLANANYKEALKQMGIGESEITAYFLDQKKALPYLQKAAASASIGAEALRQGFEFDQRYSEELATSGITKEQASAGYAKIADEYTNLATLASVYGESWSQREAEQAVFEGNATAGNKRKKLASQERAAFSGAAGGARAGLSGNRGGAY